MFCGSCEYQHILSIILLSAWIFFVRYIVRREIAISFANEETRLKDTLLFIAAFVLRISEFMRKELMHGIES